jgi:phage tail sheath protein FI
MLNAVTPIPEASARAIAPATTSVTAFVGACPSGPMDTAVQVASFAEFEREFGGLVQGGEAGYAIRQFFVNGGKAAWLVRTATASADALIGSLPVLDAVDFNLLCMPDTRVLEQAAAAKVIGSALKYCESRTAFMIVDMSGDADTVQTARNWIEANRGLASPNGAVYFPSVQVPNPLDLFRLREVAPSGALAGIYARTDAAHGVWHAPSGSAAVLRGVRAVSCKLSDAENAELNPLGVNCIRSFPGAGIVSWGARTLFGNDGDAPDYKYVPIRRLELFLESSLSKGLQWAVFEPNGEPLWAEIRTVSEAFLESLFVQGAFKGNKSSEAFFVKCDKTTMTQNDIDNGRLNVTIGFAPVKPAEFVIIRIGLWQGVKTD